jgi:HEPN superfamily AbiV-like protein
VGNGPRGPRYGRRLDEDPINDELRRLAKLLGRAAAENALHLVEEANLLDDNGHKARAFALTVLAAEEMGKGLHLRDDRAPCEGARRMDAFTAMVARCRSSARITTWAGGGTILAFNGVEDGFPFGGVNRAEVHVDHFALPMHVPQGTLKTQLGFRPFGFPRSLGSA